MTRNSLQAIGLFFLASVCFGGFFLAQNSADNEIEKHRFKHELDKRTRADLAAQQNFQMTVDASTGTIPRERLWRTVERLRDEQRYHNKAAITGINWTERGPSNVSGRTRAIAFDLNDTEKDKIYAGSVAGGLWVCENIYAGTPAWSAVDEFLENLAVTTIAIDPSSPDTMYFGTGEGFFNIDAVRGDGIFRSTDGGENWSQLSSTTGSNFNYIQKIVVDSIGNIYAATRDEGIQKSTDNGSTWSTMLTNAIPSSGTNATTDRAADIEIAKNGDIYVCMGIFNSDGIYKSTNGGTSWTKVYTASSEERIEISCAPGNSDYVYGVSQGTSNSAQNVLRTTNGGSSWSTLTPPTSFSNQCWYNISVAINPNDETEFYIGGLDLWHSTNSGSSFTKVSAWAGTPYVHADQHIAVYSPGSSDTILFGNDGGVFLSKNATNSAPSFTFLGNNYNVTQFYSCAIHPDATENYFLAGAQDNGSHKFDAAGIDQTSEVTGGDGGFVFIDQDDPTYQFTSYTRNQYRRSTDGGASFSNVNFSSTIGLFINPTDYDNDASILYSSYGNGTYLRWTNPRTGTSSSSVTFSGSGTGQPSAIFCDPNTANRIYIGTNDGEIWRINSANGSSSATQLSVTGLGSTDYVTSIDVEDGDASHILITVSNYGANHVYESTNSGTSWTVIDGDLPDMPVRWGMFNPMNNDEVFLATELGVWTTDNINGSSTVWGASNAGLANVRTDMLQWRPSDSTLIAATHGRGLYSATFSEIIDPDFIVDKQTTYMCETVSFTDVSTGATSWAWDFDNDGVTDATTKDADWTYKEAGYKSVKLVINGTDSVTKSDFVTVIPKLGTPYSTSDGGDIESNGFHFGAGALTGGINIWERGSPGGSTDISATSSGSNIWKTDLDGDITQDDYSCAVYTPSFNMTASGTYELSFDYRMQVASTLAPFGVYVEYSTNSGANWTSLGTLDATNNWYSTSSHYVVNGGTCWSHDRTSYTTATRDVSSLSGNSDVRFRIIFEVANGWSSGGNTTILYEEDGFAFDDFELSGPTNAAYPYAVETALNASATEDLGPNDTVNFISNNCKIIAQVINLSSHDYGSTTVTVDNAGSGTMDFSTNTAAEKEICEKTILITPTTNNTSGSVKIKTYFVDAEASAWKTVSGYPYSAMNQIKSSGAISSGTISNTVYGSSTIIDSTYGGDNVAITCMYTNGFSGLGAGLDGSTGPLPVTLLSFTGKLINDLVNLDWTTTTETNTSHFDIERANRNGMFESIGSIPAAGNSSAKLDYSFIDGEVPFLSKRLLYRLKTVDLDGSVGYSQVVAIQTTNKQDIVIGPNPAKDRIDIQIPSHLESPVTVEFVNMNGQVIESYSNIYTTQKLNINSIPNGIYLVAIRQGNVNLKVEKINILH